MFLLVRETCYMSAKTKEHYFVFKLPKLGCLHSIATEVEHGHVINLYSCSVILTAIVIIFCDAFGYVLHQNLLWRVAT